MPRVDCISFFKPIASKLTTNTVWLVQTTTGYHSVLCSVSITYSCSYVLTKILFTHLTLSLHCIAMAREGFMETGFKTTLCFVFRTTTPVTWPCRCQIQKPDGILSLVHFVFHQGSSWIILDASCEYQSTADTEASTAVWNCVICWIEYNKICCEFRAFGPSLLHYSSVGKWQ